MKKLKNVNFLIIIFSVIILGLTSCTEADINDAIVEDINTSANLKSVSTEPCVIEPMTLELFVWGKKSVGWVTITNDETSVYVNYILNEGWYLAETNLYIGEKEDIPFSRRRGVDKRKFTYVDKFDSQISSYEYVIPIEEVDDCFIVIAHAKVNNCKKQVKDGKEVTYDSDNESCQRNKYKKHYRCRNKSAWANGGMSFKECLKIKEWGLMAEYCIVECEPELVFSFKAYLNENWACTSGGPADIDFCGYYNFVPDYVGNKVFYIAKQDWPLGNITVADVDNDGLYEVTIDNSDDARFQFEGEAFLYVGTVEDYNDTFRSYPYQKEVLTPSNSITFELDF